MYGIEGWWVDGRSSLTTKMCQMEMKHPEYVCKLHCVTHWYDIHIWPAGIIVNGKNMKQKRNHTIFCFVSSLCYPSPHNTTIFIKNNFKHHIFIHQCNLYGLPKRIAEAKKSRSEKSVRNVSSWLRWCTSRPSRRALEGKNCAQKTVCVP